MTKNILEMNRTEVLEALRAYVHNNDYRFLCHWTTPELKAKLAFILSGGESDKKRNTPVLGIMPKDGFIGIDYGHPNGDYSVVEYDIEINQVKDYAYDDISNVFLRSLLGNVKKTDKKYTHTFANDLGISKEVVKGTAPDFQFAWRHETRFEKLKRRIKDLLWL